jgi:hypothetical protein
MDKIHSAPPTAQKNLYKSLPELLAGLSGYELYVQVIEAHRARREAANYAPTADGLVSFTFWTVIENLISADVAAWAFNSFHGTEFRPERRGV